MGVAGLGGRKSKLVGLGKEGRRPPPRGDDDDERPGGEDGSEGGDVGADVDDSSSRMLGSRGTSCLLEGLMDGRRRESGGPIDGGA